MKTNLYVIFDKMSQESGPIQICKNDAVATRMFANAVKSDKTIEPEDYVLYRIGTYDSETMNIVPCAPSIVPLVSAEGGEV